MNRFETAIGVVIAVAVQPEERIAERHHRRNGVHNLVGQHARQSYPRLQLLIVQLTVDVVHGNDTQPRAPDRHLRSLQRQIDLSPLVMQRHTRSFANFERPELFGQPLLNPVELAQVRKNRQPQQTQRPGIGLHDAAPFVHDHNAGNDPFEDQLIIFLALDRLVLGLDQQLLDPVERPVEQVVRKRTAVTGELKGIVVVFDRIEHKRDLARIGPVEPENTA